MSTKVQVVLGEVEHEEFRRRAAREGLSLSAWMREAARARVAAVPSPSISTVEELRAFFAACDARETAPEPEWEAHLRVAEESRAAGRSTT